MEFLGQFRNISGLGNQFMVTIYWLLTMLWIIIVSIIIAYLVWRKHFVSTTRIGRTIQFFLILSILLLFDSAYWTLATTSRAGYLSISIASKLYKGWAVFTIKLIFFIAAITFIFLVKRSFKQMQNRVETLYFTQFVDNSADAIGVLNPSGKVLYWSKGAERLYGFNNYDVVGRNVKNFLVPDRFKKHLESIFRYVINNNKSVRYRTYRYRSDKSEIEVDITVTPFYLDNNKFGGFYGIMRPIDDSLAKNIQLYDTISNENSNISVPKNKDDKREDNISTKTENDIFVETKRAMILSLEKLGINYYRKNLIMWIFTFVLLLMTVLFLITGFMSRTPDKYYLLIASLITLVGEIIPIRFFKKGKADDFRYESIKLILKNEDLTLEQLTDSLKIIESVHICMKQK